MYNTEKIRYLMAQRFMTQRDLAKQAGLAIGTVSRLMLTSSCTTDTIHKVADALQVNPQELIKQEADI